mgnify:CR=1 FL=1
MRKYDLYTSVNEPINQPLPKLGILTHVEELTRYDLIYVAHKMKNGVDLISVSYTHLTLPTKVTG